jgi:hypothetical protein
LKSAKQQSQDLRQTDEFLTAIMKPGYPEKEKATKPTSFENSASRQVNGRPKMPRVDSFSRFSEPPAPPPQQPLPEKPDAPPRSGSDAFSPLKRNDTDKPKSASSNSPVSRDSSQILSLIEALSSAKREIDNQGARVKELEDLLLQERAARESAEEKVKKLEMRSGSGEEEPKYESDGHTSADEPKIKLEHHDSTVSHFDDLPTPAQVPAASEANQKEPSAEVDTTKLQRRLENMMEEMEEMRKQMSSFKERAEKAEDDSSESRKSLAEMIETLRKERSEKQSAFTAASKPEANGQDPMKTVSGHKVPTENGLTDSKIGGSSQTFDPVTSKSKELDAAATAFATQHRRNFLEEASPYASMFGVVLLGVGLMAYLNGWQKMDK